VGANICPQIQKYFAGINQRQMWTDRTNNTT